jgi:hypothetical protein
MSTTGGDLESIDLSKPRYDQSTYFGRVRHFFDVIDPRTLLTSDAELKKSVALISAHKDKLLPSGTTAEELWRAKKVRPQSHYTLHTYIHTYIQIPYTHTHTHIHIQIQDAIIHPDTKEPTFVFGRWSAFMPVNIPMAVGMMTFTGT